MSPMPTNFINILKMHEKCTETLLRRASSICPNDAEFSTDQEVIKIRKMVNSVLAENHMMKAFVRLKPQGERVLYGYMRPKHDVWLMVSTFFVHRFPGTIIVLGNNTKSWVSIYDGKVQRHSQAGSMAGTLEELERILGKDDTEDPEELWDTYYWSQYRPEAKNTRYFKSNVRQKYARAAGMQVETDSGGTTLDDFS